MQNEVGLGVGFEIAQDGMQFFLARPDFAFTVYMGIIREHQGQTKY